MILSSTWKLFARMSSGISGLCFPDIVQEVHEAAWDDKALALPHHLAVEPPLHCVLGARGARA
jgi:hypothetical protein